MRMAVATPKPSLWARTQATSGSVGQLATSEVPQLLGAWIAAELPSTAVGISHSKPVAFIEANDAAVLPYAAARTHVVALQGGP